MIAVSQIPSLLQIFCIWIGLSNILFRAALSHNKQLCMNYSDDLECITTFSSWSGFLTITLSLTGTLSTATMFSQNNWFPFIGLFLGLTYWGMFVRDLRSGQIHEQETLMLLAIMTWIVSIFYLVFAISILP